MANNNIIRGLILFNISTFFFLCSLEDWQSKYQEAIKENRDIEERLANAEKESGELQMKYR